MPSTPDTTFVADTRPRGLEQGQSSISHLDLSSWTISHQNGGWGGSIGIIPLYIIINLDAEKEWKQCTPHCDPAELIFPRIGSSGIAGTLLANAHYSVL